MRRWPLKACEGEQDSARPRCGGNILWVGCAEAWREQGRLLENWERLHLAEARCGLWERRREAAGAGLLAAGRSGSLCGHSWAQSSWIPAVWVPWHWARGERQ